MIYRTFVQFSELYLLLEKRLCATPVVVRLSRPNSLTHIWLLLHSKNGDTGSRWRRGLGSLTVMSSRPRRQKSKNELITFDLQWHRRTMCLEKSSNKINTLDYPWRTSPLHRRKSNHFVDVSTFGDVRGHHGRVKVYNFKLSFHIPRRLEVARHNKISIRN